MVPYLEHWQRRGLTAGRITRHLLQLFAGRPGARVWRRHLSEHGPRAASGPELLRATMARIPAEVLDENQTSTSTSSPTTRTG